MGMTETLNQLGRAWTLWALSGLVDASVAAVVLLLIWLTVRRMAPAWLGCALFLLVFVKMLLPVPLSVPEPFAKWTPRTYIDRWLDQAKFDEGSSHETPVPTRWAPWEGDLNTDDTGRGDDVLIAASPSSLDTSSAPISDSQTDPPLAVESNDSTEPSDHAEVVRDDARLGSAVSTGAASDGRLMPAGAPFDSKAASTSSARMHVSTWLMVVWCSVVICLVARLVWNHLHFLRIVRRARPIDVGRWPVDTKALSRKCGCRRPVRFLESPEIVGPAVWGLLRPSVLLPAGIEVSLSREQLTWVLLHELAHVRRFDVFAAVFQRGVTVLHFFNPAIWFAGFMVDRLREYACDDAAVLLGRIPPRESGAAFLHVVEYAATSPRQPRAALGVFDVRTTLRSRLTRLLDGRRTIRTGAGIGSLGVLLLTAAAILPQIRAAVDAPAVAVPANDHAIEASDAKPETNDDAMVVARQFMERLENGEFRRAAELFRQSLREQLTVERLMHLWDEYERPQRAGAFQEVLSCDRQELYGTTVVEVRGRWEKAIMLVRLMADDDEITGFWLARDKKGPTPKGFRRGGYAYGRAITQLAERMHPEAYKKPGDLGIDVRIMDTDGNPIDEFSSVTIWQQVDATPEPRSYSVVDPRDGTIWKRVSGSFSGQRSETSNGKDRFLAEPLDPGIYRATVFVGSRQEKMIGMAFSDPIRLDGSEKIVTAKISIEAGPSVTFAVSNAETRAPIEYPRPGIRLTRADGFDVEWNPLNGNLFPGDDGKYRIEHLAPGPYRVEISTKSYAYGYPDLELAEPITIDVHDDQPNDFVLELPPKPVDEEEAERRWPWAVEGVVTDTQGRPVEGVAIRAACGWGTLRSTLPVLSDRDGRYLLRFGPGMRGGGIQAATISARKAGYAEKNLGRQGGLLMSDTLPEEDSRWDREKVILPGKPYRIDFTMVPAASVEGQLLDEDGKPLADQRVYLTGDVLGPSSSVAGSGRTNAEGRCQFEGIAPGVARWFELPDSEDLVLARTQSVTLDEGTRYRIVWQILPQDNVGRMFRVASIEDAQGRDVVGAVRGDDPRARPFVDEKVEQQARQVLDRAAEANRYWFRALSKDVESFSYTFHLAGHDPRKITYDDYANATSWYREWYPKGISYTGAARVLVSLRDRAKFRVVEIDDEQISIYFVLRGLPSTVAAGNGIARTWSGFFSTRMNEGRIKLDAKRLTPISIEYGDRSEIYSDYVEVVDGSFVPRRIQILSPGTEYDFRFRLFKPNMWLLDRSIPQGGDGEDKPVAWTGDIMINGEPAIPHTGDDLAR